MFADGTRCAHRQSFLSSSLCTRTEDIDARDHPSQLQVCSTFLILAASEVLVHSYYYIFVITTVITNTTVATVPIFLVNLRGPFFTS